MSVLVNASNKFQYTLSSSFYTSSRTIAFWCKPSVLGYLERFLFFSGNDPYAYILIYNDSLEVDMPDGSGPYFWRLATLNSFSTVNIWYHVCVTIDYKQSGRSATDMKVYVNGVESSYQHRSYSSLYTFYHSATFSIGGSPYNEMPFIGEVADYGVWFRELNTSEISALYNGLSPLYLRKSLSHYMPFINNTHNVIEPYYTPVIGTHYQDPIRRHFPSKPKSDFYTFKWWEAPAPQPKKDRPSLIFLGGEIFQF